MVNFSLVVLMLVDFANFSYGLPNYSTRFSRFFRPVLLFLYNKELTRQIKAVYLSRSEIFQLMMFIGGNICFFALISVIVIGNISAPHDELSENYGNFLTMLITLYALLSFDGYPDVMLPAL